MKGRCFGTVILTAGVMFSVNTNVACAQGWQALPYSWSPGMSAWNPCPPMPPLSSPYSPRPAVPFMPPPLDKAGAAFQDPRVRESKQPPMVIESKGAQPYQSKKAEVSRGPCRVGFWNVTGRDVNLQVAGRTMIVPRDRSIVLDLDRQFVWQTEERNPHTENVPDGARTFEVIIR